MPTSVHSDSLNGPSNLQMQSQYVRGKSLQALVNEIYTELQMLFLQQQSHRKSGV